MKEPTNNLDEIVPGRLTSAELRAMALRQQQQIDSQQQILTTKEQRLRFLKSQEIRNAVANSEGERLRRLRERVEAQESKLRRLRALRGQVDLQKTYNVTLSNDLDSIRALFSEKEKELSLAVAKVDALTRQLEDLRRDRRCPINLIVGSENGAAQPLPPQASRELEKLRRELMFRNQLSMQQDARLHLQREALQQRQAELRSVDQRIYELQTRLQRKKAANIQIVAQNQNHQLQHQPHLTQQQQQRQHQQQQSEQQQLQKQQQHTYNVDAAFQTNLAKHGGVAALKQQLLQKQTSHITTPQQHVNNKFSNIINREPNRNIQRGNVAAVEPYIHTPQKSTITPPTSNFSSAAAAHNILKHAAAATANTNQQNQLIQDLSHHVKLNLSHAAAAAASGHLNKENPNYISGESDESKLAKKILTATIAAKAAAAETPKQQQQQHQQSNITDNSKHIYAEIGPKKRDLAKEINTNTMATSNLEGHQQQQQTSSSNFGSIVGSKIPKSIAASTATTASSINSKSNQTPSTSSNAEMAIKEKKPTESSTAVVSETLSEKNIIQQQITVHSTPLGTANKSVATAVSAVAAALSTTESLLAKPKLSSSSCNIAVPPRKPFNSVAPTSVSSSIPKMITYSPKVNRVAPNVIATATSSTAASLSAAVDSNVDRPALPPKPSKLSPTEKSATNSEDSIASAAPMTAAKKTHSAQAEVQTTTTASSGGSGGGGIQSHNINDNLPIKAKPLTIRKQPMSEQPRLKTITTGTGTNKQTTLQNIRKIDVSPAPPATVFLFPDASSKRSVLKESNERHSPEQQQQYSPNAQNSPPSQSSNNSSTVDELDKSEYNKDMDISPPDILKRRTSANAGSCATTATIVKPKLARRVSFDPLALLLDASLEGELELVKKTAMQVANASAANDEGITALHNAICAGHFDIVKFLVEFGCDVNAQDSDGWTPLHCAASCNNLSMVKFLVESGACLFAATLSDHETPAEKCEEDEEGFDGCSEYLYSIQEKLGILHSGEVYPVFSYDAQNNDELSFSVNDRLIILRKGDDAESEWWWAKNVTNEEGYVPRNLLGLYPRIPPQSPNFND